MSCKCHRIVFRTLFPLRTFQGYGQVQSDQVGELLEQNSQLETLLSNTYKKKLKKASK